MLSLLALALASPVDLALGEEVHELALSPDGAHLAVADDGLLAIRDAQTLALVWAPAPQTDRWRRVVWVDDSTLEATHVSGATYAFDVTDRSIEGRPTQPTLGSGDKDRRLAVQRLAARPVDVLKEYDRHVYSGFPLLPQGRTPTVWSDARTIMDYGQEGIFAGDDTGVVHTVRDGALVSSERLGGAVRALLPSADGVMARTDDGTLVLLDQRLDVQVRSRGPLEEPADAVVLDADGRFAWIGRPHGGLARVDLKRGRVRAEQPGGAAHRDVSTRDDTVLTVDADDATLWDVARGRRLWTLEGSWSQGVQLGDHSVLLAPDGQALWVDGRGRTVREVCVTASCDEPLPAFLAVSDDDRLVVLEPSFLLSLREIHAGRLSVRDRDGTLQQAHPIEHVARQRPTLGDRELVCGRRPIGSVLDLFPSDVVDMDFAVGSDIVLCDLRLSLDTLEVTDDLYRRPDEEYVGTQGSTVFTIEGGSTSGRTDRLWVRPEQGDRYLLVDPDRQARLSSRVRWDQGRLVVFGTGITAAGGLLRYTDLSPYEELPPVERPPAAPADPESTVAPHVVGALPPIPPHVGSQTSAEGPTGRLTWRAGQDCTPPTAESIRAQAPMAFGPPPIHTVDVLEVRARALDGHAFPEHLAALEGWLGEGLDGNTVVERAEALGLSAKMKRLTWTVGKNADDAFDGADATWQPRLHRPLLRTWVRRGPSSEGRTQTKVPWTGCQELLLDDVPKGSLSLGRGKWAATQDGFLYLSDMPHFIDADGVAQPEHPLVKALGNHYLGAARAQPSLHLGAAVDGDTLVVRLPSRLVWLDLATAAVHEHFARGGFKLLVLHDGAAWVLGAVGDIVGYEPDGTVRQELPKFVDPRGGGIRQLWRHDDTWWAKTAKAGTVVRWHDGAWQPVVVDAP